MPTVTLSRDTSVEAIPLNKITGEFDRNVRTEYDQADLEELADSIAAHGLIQPITVVGGPDVPNGDGNYAVHIGHRRYRALLILKARKVIKADTFVPCVVDNTAHTSGEMSSTGLARQLIENLQRVDLSAIDEARGYARMTEEHGYTQRDLAAAVGKSPGHIAKRLALLSLPAEVQALIEHKITIEQGYRLSQLDEDQIKKLTKNVVGGGQGVSLDYDLMSAEQTKGRRQKSEKLKAYLDKNMIEVVKYDDAFPLGRERYDHIGWFDLDKLKAHDLKKNQIVVAGNSMPMTDVQIYRVLTPKQVESLQLQRDAEEEQRDAEQKAAEAEYIATEANPHEVWEYEVGQLEDAYHDARDVFFDAVNSSLGQMLTDLAPREVGKVTLALVATKALEQAQASCTTLGIHPPHETDEGAPLSSWQRDWRGALREWIGDDTTRAITAWIAGHVTVSDVQLLDVFGPFRDQLAEHGVTAPVEPDYEAIVGPEPWYDEETDQWHTDVPEPEAVVDHDEAA